METSAYGAATVLCLLALTALFPAAARAQNGATAPAGMPGHIIESCTEDVKEARGREFAGSKGGPENNTLENVASPVRAGKTAFKHGVNTRGERSELAMSRTEIGGTYWYGWSMFLPEEFDHRGSKTIVMQLAAWPTPRNGKFPCRANGPFLHIDAEGALVFHLQHKGDDKDMVCDEFTLAEDVSKLKGKWLDFVMHAKWTGDPDGFFKFWLKVHDNHYAQKVDYRGRTWWNDEDKGPYFKMGVYTGEPGWKGPPERTLYTDEYRLGGARSGFDAVAPPGARARTEEAGKGRIEYRTYRSALNSQDVAIMVYTPPGYESSGERYPVVYNLHGAGGGSPARQWDRTRATLTGAMESGKVRPMIYVFVNGLGDTFFMDFADGSVKAESMIVKELIPWVDASYRTVASKEGRALDGFSMGGFGCLMLAFKHPDLFSSVVSYGAALIDVKPGGRWGEKEHADRYSPWVLAGSNQDKIRAGLWVRMVCGDQDRLFPNNVRFKALLDDLKIPVSWAPVGGVAHDTKGLYERVGRESLEFIAAGFDKAKRGEAQAHGR